MSAVEPDQWSAMAERIRKSISDHSPRVDGMTYNGGTIVVLAATSAAAFLGPVDLDSWEWVPPALSGLAAFLVAMERALNFGARWRYQLAMRAGYEHVLDQIDFLRTLPEEEQKRYRAEIVAELRALRRREGMIPGVGAPVDEAAV